MIFVVTGYGAGRIHLGTSPEPLLTVCGRKLRDGLIFHGQLPVKYQKARRCERCFKVRA